MTPQSRRAFAAAILGSMLGLGPLAKAQSTGPETELRWRMTSVVTAAQPPRFERRGVVMLHSGEPGTARNTLTASAPPQDGRWSLNNDLTLRFEDASTLTLRYSLTVRTGADGRVLPGEYAFQGEVTGGSGRYAGARGSLEAKAVLGLDRTQVGMLGDSFMEAVARVRQGP